MSDQFSPNGATIMTGQGVAAVRKRIEQAFEQSREVNVRTDVPTDARTSNARVPDAAVEAVEEVRRDAETRQGTLPQRPLADRAETYIKAADHQLRHVSLSNYGPRVYHVATPQESAQQLIDDAVKSLRA